MTDDKHKGIILGIEKCAIHDGPGIRTLIFSKGCPLRCKWCSTPQSWHYHPELSFSSDNCTRCGKCFDVCPADAIIPDEAEYLEIDREACTNCGICCEVCHPHALKLIGQYMTPEELFSIALQDILFYRNSNGGVTLSGREPATWPEFCLEFLKKCHEHNISTAIESCLYVKWEYLERVLKYLDLIYIDLKCMDKEKHANLTGVSNQLIIDNTIKVDKSKVPVVIRVPVVPGYNDDEENIKAILGFAAGLTNVTRIELLPYHGLGVSEYKRLGRNYGLEYLKPPNDESLVNLSEIIESHGLEAQIGG